MREIKFRAWVRCGKWAIDEDKQEFGMVSADAFAFEESAPISELLVDIPDEQYIMQYTGLKDKNGKEIYEGDILELNKGEYEEVIWKEDEACFAIRDVDAYITCGLLEKDSEEYLEVIGNIYENLELLKEDNNENSKV